MKNAHQPLCSSESSSFALHASEFIRS